MPSQTEILEDCGKLYRSTFKKAYTGKSRAAAIKAMCLHCVGYERKEVTNCTNQGCPLYAYRPYQEKA